jgi:pyrimidine-specific ribonucleoside hydrolase
MTERIPLAIDLELQDPDEWALLCLAASHPAVELKCVTVIPGRPQAGLVREVLRRCGCEDVVVGALDPDSMDICQADIVAAHAGLKLKPEPPDADGPTALAEAAKVPGIRFVSAAPPKNIGRLPALATGAQVAELHAQGGYAGPPVHPEDRVLPEFIESAGNAAFAVRSFNWSSAPEDALQMLESSAFGKILVYPKSVCHDVWFDQDLLTRIAASSSKSPGLALIERYFANYRHERKLFHDVLPFCTMIEPECCEFAADEVRFARQDSRWFCYPEAGTRTYAAIGYDRARFEDVMCRTD